VGGLALVAALAGAPGCVVGQYREGNEVPLEMADRIRPGVTTKQEILEWFGPPQNYTSASIVEQLIATDNTPPGTVPPYRFSDVLAYEVYHGEMRGLFLLFFNSLRFDVRSDHFVVFFDDDDIVQYYGVRRADDR
jgi:hypothetical protein